MIVFRQLWFLLLCVLLGVFAPSRADARLAETRTWVFAPEVAETRLETESQAVGTHQENGLWNYEHAPGCTQAAETAPAKLFHYTSERNVAGILENGLRPGAGGKVFTTPAGNLTPMQAQIELALSPNRGLPGAVFEIDTAALRQLGINPSAGPMRVLPTSNAAGGGVEVIFNSQIPPSALRLVPGGPP